MVPFLGPVEFWMGSPPGKPTIGRRVVASPPHRAEFRHRQHEGNGTGFKAFRKTYPEQKAYGPIPIVLFLPEAGMTRPCIVDG